MAECIGLTGLYCAGKNHVAALLEKRGLPVLDVDRLGHEALRTEREAIVRRFGSAVLGAGGQVDRQLLGRQVFGRAEELAALEAIVHPAANRLTDAWIKRQSGPCVINAALLHRSSAFVHLDSLIVVRSPFLIRLYRARKRDKLPLKVILKRFSSQNHFPFRRSGAQLFSTAADIYIVKNSGFPGSQRTLEKRIDVILEGLQNHGRKEKTTARSGFSRGVSGNCGRRRNPGL
jgi:dephospho-CoA kinase